MKIPESLHKILLNLAVNISCTAMPSRVFVDHKGFLVTKGNKYKILVQQIKNKVKLHSSPINKCTG